jgi:hypothetical protein
MCSLRFLRPLELLAWYAQVLFLIRVLHSHIYLAGICSRERHFYRNRRSPFGVYPRLLGVGKCNQYIYQAAKDVRASQDTLVNVFQRVESFFRRLEVYTQVPPTTEMMDTIVQIMVEILSILGIAMKEIKQGRMSEQFGTSICSSTER